MPALIVTHYNPDLDAVMSAWLLVRFAQSRFGDAELAFCPAGKTYKDELVDSDPEIVHVDTGRGVYDHHQPGRTKTCAAKLVWESLKSEGYLEEENKPLEVMIEYVYEIDSFQDCYWPEAENPRYAFMLHEILPALHSLQIYDNEAVARMGFSYLDAAYQSLKNVEHAKKNIEEAEKFESAWGRGVAIAAETDDLSKVAQRMGYQIVVSFHPKKKYLKIKTAPRVSLDLKPLHDKIRKKEDGKIWFYHNSGHILLSGSDKSAPEEITNITMQELLQMIKEVTEEKNKTKK